MPVYGSPIYGEGIYEEAQVPDPSTGRVAWSFYDGVNIYNLDVNPSSASMPTIGQKRLTTQMTAAGTPIVYEGRKEAKTISFSGVILEEFQYRLFLLWVNMSKQIRITDDLGLRYWIYIKSFSPKRRKDSAHPWLMDYSIEGFVLDR